jgi:hypothetical protein
LGIKDRLERNAYIRKVRLVVRTVETEVKRRTRNVTSDSGLSEEQAANLRTIVAINVWGNVTRFKGQQDFPGLPLALGAHVFLILTGRRIFNPAHFGRLARQFLWLDKAGVTKAHMEMLWEHPYVLGTDPDDFTSLCGTPKRFWP